MTDVNKMYAVKRVHSVSKIIEWLTVDDDGSHDWIDDREERELMANKPSLYDFDRVAGWRHFIVTVGDEPKAKTMSVTLDQREHVLFDLKSNDVYVITPGPIGESQMTWIGTTFTSVVNHFRYTKR